MADPAARHIALLGHRLAAPSPTGIGRYYVEVATGLAKVTDPSKHRYTVATLSERAHPSWVAPPLALGSLGGPRKPRTLAWALTGRPNVDRSLGHPDLVHVLQPWAPIPTRAPLVVTVHDLMPMLRPEWHGRMESWLYGRGIEHTRDHAALVLTNSQHTADVVAAEVGIEQDRMRVVWFGVGDEFRSRPSTEEQAAVCVRHGVEPGRYLIAVGAVSTRKNLGVVLAALARTDLSLLGPVALLAAGPPGRGAEEISAEVDRLGLTGRVRFTGFVPGGDLPVLVGAARALVHPSRDEGFGLTPLEAMAAGVPAIASDVGSLPEVTDGAAVLVGPEDVDGWAAAITAVAGDDDHHAALVAAGDRRQARFTWTRACEDTLAAHDEVLA
jgi:glycosyltransferase involved in cell wall biosynthesis